MVATIRETSLNPTTRMRKLGGTMKVARIVVSVVASLVMALAVVGTAAADPPDMTHNSMVPEMTHN